MPSPASLSLTSLLVHPLARGRDIDSPETTHLRKRILAEKPFLHKIYEEWYDDILRLLPGIQGRVLEIGTGSGFLSDRIHDLITSDIFSLPGVNLVLDSRHLPFAADSLRAIVMTNVLHHIPDPDLFFAEATRCVRTGGSIIMIEPWHSPWSRWVYTHLHHEPFRPDVEQWAFPSSGPLSGANGALPWIMFERDYSRFRLEHPQWQIVLIRPIMPFRYLLSGGVSYRSFMPGWTFGLWREIETALRPCIKHVAMFVCISLERRAG